MEGSLFDRPFLRSVVLLRDEVPSFDTYPFSLPAIKALDELQLHKNVTFLVGENGSGKSTLLEAIAVAAGFNAEGGSRNFRFSTRASESELHKYLRLVRGVRRPKDGFFLRAESYFNVGTEVEALGISRALAYHVLPISLGPNCVVVACEKPLSEEAQKELARAVGQPVEYVLSDTRPLEPLILNWYSAVGEV